MQKGREVAQGMSMVEDQKVACGAYLNLGNRLQLLEVIALAVAQIA